MKKIIATTAAPAAIGPYSQGIDGGSVVITSGQLPIDPATGAFAEGGVAGQRMSRPSWPGRGSPWRISSRPRCSSRI